MMDCGSGWWFLLKRGGDSKEAPRLTVRWSMFQSSGGARNGGLCDYQKEEDQSERRRRRRRSWSNRDPLLLLLESYEFVFLRKVIWILRVSSCVKRR